MQTRSARTEPIVLAAAAFCAFLLTLVIKFINPVFETRQPFFLLTTMVAVVSLLSGPWGGVVASLAALVITDVVALQDRPDATQLIALELPALLLTSVLVGSVADRLRREMRDADAERLRFEQIAESVAEGIIECSLDGQCITFANAAARRMLGYSRRLEGEPLNLLMKQPYRDRHHNAVQAYRESGFRTKDWQEMYWPAVRADGTVIDLELSMTEYVIGGEQRFCATVRQARVRT